MNENLGRQEAVGRQLHQLRGRDVHRKHRAAERRVERRKGPRRLLVVGADTTRDGSKESCTAVPSERDSELIATVAVPRPFRAEATIWLRAGSCRAVRSS